MTTNMLSRRGTNTSRITKVETRADDEMVQLGAVTQVDKDGNDHADEAADLGGRPVGDHILDAHRMFSQACHYWYLLYLSSIVFVARIVVKNDDEE